MYTRVTTHHTTSKSENLAQEDREKKQLKALDSYLKLCRISLLKMESKLRVPCLPGAGSTKKSAHGGSMRSPAITKRSMRS